MLICYHLGPTEKAANLPSGTKGRFSCDPVYSGVTDEWAMSGRPSDRNAALGSIRLTVGCSLERKFEVAGRTLDGVR